MRHLPRAAKFLLVAAGAALLAGGGYAVAATRNKSIHGCIDNRTRVLHVQKGRCHPGQIGIAWNRQGPAGPRGPQGAEGPAAASAWAVIGTSAGNASVSSGRNISVRYDAVGQYTVSAGGACAGIVGAIQVNPEGPPGYAAGHVPVAYATKESGTFNVFDVHVEDVGAGTATPVDGLAFDVTVSCQ
jgi:hypothetical protein